MAAPKELAELAILDGPKGVPHSVSLAGAAGAVEVAFFKVKVKRLPPAKLARWGHNIAEFAGVPGPTDLQKVFSAADGDECATPAEDEGAADETVRLRRQAALYERLLNLKKGEGETEKKEG